MSGSADLSKGTSGCVCKAGGVTGAKEECLSHLGRRPGGLRDGTKRTAGEGGSIPFSAFWLRSSVVSVLISLISDTRGIAPLDVNLIFPRVRVHPPACCSDSRVSPWSCTTSLAGAAPPPCYPGGTQYKILNRTDSGCYAWSLDFDSPRFTK